MSDYVVKLAGDVREFMRELASEEQKTLSLCLRDELNPDGPSTLILLAIPGYWCQQLQGYLIFYRPLAKDELLRHDAEHGYFVGKIRPTWQGYSGLFRRGS